MPLHGKNPDGSNTDGSKEYVPDKPKQQALGTTIGRKNTGIVTESGNPSGKEIKELSDEEKRVNEDEKSKKQTGGSRKGIKRLPKHTGDAPEGVKSETELVGGRNTQVGVGVKAHKKLEENPQGELTESQKPVDPNKKDKRVKDLNDQNPRSAKGRAHTTRTRENMKYYNDDQKAAYDKIDPKDRTAQSKFHDEQDKKYGKSVSTPKKLSTAGQAIKDKLKKSNDIILDMNIMKLDLNKISTFKPKMNKRGGRILNPDSDDDRSFGEIRAQEEVRVQNEKDKLSKLGKSADETIFKTISLKLDLMKDATDGKGSNKPHESGNEWGNHKQDGEIATGLNPQEFQGQSTQARRSYNKPAHLRGDKFYSPKPFSQEKVYDRENRGGTIKQQAQYQRSRTKDPRDTSDDDSMRDSYGARNVTEAQRKENESNELAYWRKHGKAPPQKKPSKPLSGKAPSDLGKSASETIFKAISLKLDLMKTRKLNNSPLESVSRLTPKQRKIEADKFLQDTTQYTPKQRKARENAAWEQKDRQNKETQEIYDATFPENR